MSDVWCPDGAGSRALLLGTSEYRSPELPSIPAVRSNLDALRTVFTDPERGLLAAGGCRVLDDRHARRRPGPAAVGSALSEAAREAEDLLFVYYSGHGLLDDAGQLYLSLADTDPEPDMLAFGAVPVRQVVRLVGRARARARVLILDCCYSGRAVPAMGTPQSVITEQLARSGTYTMTSTTRTELSFAPPGAPHTAFTAALLRALREPEPLSLDGIYSFVHDELAGRDLPRPQRRAVNAAGSLVLTRPRPAPRPAPVPRQPATPAPAPAPAPVTRGDEEIEFALPPLTEEQRRARRTTSRVLLSAAVPVFLCLWFLAQSPPFACGIAAGLLLTSLGFSVAASAERPSLSVGAEGLRYSPAPAGGLSPLVPWTDILYVGLLHEIEMLEGDSMRTFQNVVVLRLRPGAEQPKVSSLAGGQLQRLGYCPLGVMKDFGLDPVLLREAVLRCAPSGYRTNSELLDLDPRLVSPLL